MKISEAIEELQAILKREGDLELTCTSSVLRDSTDREDNLVHPGLACVWESTVENFIVNEKPWNNGQSERIDLPKKRVRVWL